jgi:hypothetical protein
MAEEKVPEKLSEKEGFWNLTKNANGESQLAECSNDQNWLVSVHLLWIRSISLCNRLAKIGLQGRNQNLHIFIANFFL